MKGEIVANPMPNRVSTGVPGLDEIMNGGYVADRTYLLSGPPGSGKTTLGWHFLTAGVAAGEPVMFITFGESERDLIENASYSGFDPSGISFCDLSPSSEMFAQVRSYDIFPASEVELEPTTARITEAVSAVLPKRVFIDSMTALRYLSNDALQFRRQTLSFLRYIKDRGGCVLMTSEASADAPDDDMRFLADGVLELAFGSRAGVLSVAKLRGSDYRPGQHTLRLGERGAALFPRLIPESYARSYEGSVLPWGDAMLDQMTHGGLERGSITLISGPSGVGKTTIAAKFMAEAARRGWPAAIYTFDERATTLAARCESVGMSIAELIARDVLRIVAVEALKYSADEFADMVLQDVEHNGTRVVMIDSISGYRLSVAEENLNERLHALCRYLQNVGVTVILVNELLEIAEFRITDVGITYIADNVVLLRYIEARGPQHAVVGRIIGVLKKRSSDFEKTFRRFELGAGGLRIGEPVDHLGGLMGGWHEIDRTVAV